MEEYIITQRSKQVWLIGIITGSVLMFSIDYSMMNISLPSIAKYFNASLASVAMLPMVYLLVVTSTLLGFGKLGDIRGYKDVFIWGCSLFLAGALMCGISPNMHLLIASRVAQSTGEAMLSPAGMALVTSLLPDNKRGIALGILATAQGFGIAIGSVIGGLINAHFVWRAIFFINIPLIAVVIFLAIKLLPSKQAKAESSRFDYPGAILISVALASLVIGMNFIARGNFKQPSVIISFIVSPIAFALFIIREKRCPHPLLDLSFFSNKDFVLANISAFFATFLLIGFAFLAPFYMEMIKELRVSQAGAILVIPSLAMMILAPVSGRLSDRMSASILCAVGMAISAAAFIVLSFINHDSNIFYLLLSLLLLGIGAGTFLAPNNKFVMASAPQDKQGAASGVYKIFLNTGSVFGIALFPLVVTSAAKAMAVKNNVAIAQIKQSPDILQFGFRCAFIFGIFVCFMGFVFSILTKDKNIKEL